MRHVVIDVTMVPLRSGRAQRFADAGGKRFPFGQRAARFASSLDFFLAQ